MDITFRTARLRKLYANQTSAEKAWGQKIGRRYQKRIGEIYAAENADDLAKMPALRFHPLKGDMQGKYAVNLDETWRIILAFTDDACSQAVVEEVSNHYGD